jgi:phage-related protein
MTNEAVIDFGDDPLVKGPCAIVAYARRENGSRPAKDFIEDLERPDQAKLAKSFHRMASTGKINNPARFRKLGGRSGKIYEFKIYPKARVLCFQRGITWFLTHGFSKETNKTPPIQIERAEEIMREHLSLLKQ